MEKTYKIKPLQWDTEVYPDDQYGEGFTEHSAQGVNFYLIHEDSDGAEYTIYDNIGNYIRFSGNTGTLDEAKRYCEAHYIKTMKRNLIEL